MTSISLSLITSTRICAVVMWIVRGVSAFQKIPANPYANHGSRPTRRNGIVRLLSSSNPNDSETPQERDERMKLVQQIQNAFYQDENDDLATSSTDPTILHQVPLWRVQWTELPGYQNVLNCHVPHYTHMFQRILRKPKPWLFGHVFLPGGSTNLDNPDYQLPVLDERDDAPTATMPPVLSSSQATLIGTLMQVTDHQQLEDGRLVLIVQAMERFRILYATQISPYAMATIQLEPDTIHSNVRDEKSQAQQRLMAVQENDEWREWEFRPTFFRDVSSEKGEIAVSPLVNYDDTHFPNEMQLTSPSSKYSEYDEMEQLEINVWQALDTMIRLLAKINPGMRIPVPAQLLGLLPTNARWPASFQLDQYAIQLQEENAKIGTATKSPFVRVSENASYPLSRRAARLSYVICIILESILVPGAPTKQQLLQERIIGKRLKMAYDQLETVNNALEQSLG